METGTNCNGFSEDSSETPVTDVTGFDLRTFALTDCSGDATDVSATAVSLGLSLDVCAYDGAPTYQMIAQYGDDIEVVKPPRKTAVPGTESRSPSQRYRHLFMLNKGDRLAWQEATGRNHHGSL